MLLNDNGRAHIFKAEASDCPCGCPPSRANCCSVPLRTFGSHSFKSSRLWVHLVQTTTCSLAAPFSAIQPPPFLTLYNAQHGAHRQRGQNWGVIKSPFMSQMCLQDRKLWGCFARCTTGELQLIAFAGSPHQGDMTWRSLSQEEKRSLWRQRNALELLEVFPTRA